jgi:hypothetical protein
VKPVIRILHLEDNVTDAEFVRSMLDADAVHCEVVRVESREAFAAALDEGGFDLNVSDLRSRPMMAGRAWDWPDVNAPMCRSSFSRVPLGKKRPLKRFGAAPPTIF